MATRFTIHQYSASKPAEGSQVTQYTIYIHDAEYNGNSTELEGWFKIKNHDLSVEEPLKPIIRSSANISVLCRETDTEFEAFLEELVGADELRFTVDIYRNFDEKIFRGHIVTDGVSYPDEYYPFQVDLTASDGLNRLKNIEYRNINGTPFTGFATIAQHLLNCIKLIGFSYAGNQVVMKTLGFEWREDDQVESDALIDKIRCFHSVWQEYASYPDLKCANAYNVLKDILTAFNARIFQSDGVFVIQQINSFSSSKLCTWRDDGTYTAVNFSRSKVFTTDRTDGAYTFYPAIRQATSTFNYKYSINKNNLLPNPCPVNTNINIGQFTGSNNHFILNVRIRSNFNFTTVAQCFAVYRITIKVGTLTLSGRYSQYFGNLPMNWGNGNYTYYICSPLAGLGNTSNIVQFEMVTPAFDEEGEATVNFAYVGTYQTPDLPYGGTGDVFTYNVEKLQLMQLQGSTAGTSGSIVYKGINLKSDGITPITSTAVTELEASTIGDGPEGFSVSKLDVMNSFGLWVPSEAWKPFSTYNGASLPIHKLRILEYLSLQKSTIKTFEFTYLGFCKQYNTLRLGSEEYLIIGWELDPEWDCINVSGFKISQNRSNIRIEEVIQGEESTGSGGGYSGYGDPSADGHIRKHSMIDAEDHAPAGEGDRNKLVQSNPIDGKIEFVSKSDLFDSYIVQPGKLLGRVGREEGPMEQISIGNGLAFDVDNKVLNCTIDPTNPSDVALLSNSVLINSNTAWVDISSYFNQGLALQAGTYLITAQAHFTRTTSVQTIAGFKLVLGNTSILAAEKDFYRHATMHVSGVVTVPDGSALALKMHVFSSIANAVSVVASTMSAPVAQAGQTTVISVIQIA